MIPLYNKTLFFLFRNLVTCKNGCNNQEAKNYGMSAHSILVIDDEPSARDFARSILETEGYNVFAVNSVDAGIALLAGQDDITMVICDINMPDKDGFEFLHYLNSNLRYASIPLLFSSGRAEGQTVKRAKAMGARGFLAKPFLGQDLIRRVTYTLKSDKGIVLIVSKDQLSLNVMARTIFIAHYMPLMASSLESARDTLENRQIDILMADLSLGDNSGLDLVVEVKESFYKIPTIIVKGSQDTMTGEEIISAGADAVLEKPLTNLDVIKKLEIILQTCRCTSTK